VLWIELPKGVSALKLHEIAMAEKISIAPGPMFSATQGFPNFIRLNCGHPWSAEIERAVETLGRLVKKLILPGFPGEKQLGLGEGCEVEHLSFAKARSI